MKHFTIHEIKSWERFYRANFINSLSGFKSATLIGTAAKDGNPNLAIFSNIVHLGADPALIGFINRPKEAAPHTIANIENTGIYSMNHVHHSFIEQAHQTSAKYEERENEFDATGLGIEWKKDIKVPFVAASRIKYLMQLQEIIPIKLNGTFFVIGAVQDVFIEDAIISGDGFLHLEESGTVTSLGIDAYYSTNLLGRFAYAKPNQKTARIV